MLPFVMGTAFLLLGRARLRRPARANMHAVAATILPESMLERAGLELRQGNLVAFPTETVYGLGANALNSQACRNIFHTKGRPLTDPLIVHVTSVSWARDLLELTPAQEAIFNALAERFWPGPLTIVGKASLKCFGNVETINTISASTGQIGVRIPSHEIARRLIDFAQVPIAAPSANRFGHVSPTSAQHVMDDLGAFPIFIIENTRPQSACAVGIESTVVGLGAEGNSLTLFRRGGISEHLLLDALHVLNVSLKLSPSLATRDQSSNNDATAQVAPGQLLTHYSPDNVECFLWQAQAAETAGVAPVLPFALKETVIVDFNGQLRRYAKLALAYQDLSPTGDYSQACNRVFAVLRWTETIAGARAVILPDVLSSHAAASSASAAAMVEEDRHSAAALDDRLFRAASGKRVGRILEEGASV